MTPHQIAETAARSLRGALEPMNLKEQSAVSRAEMLAYWRDALIKLGDPNPPTDYCQFVIHCDRLARPVRIA